MDLSIGFTGYETDKEMRNDCLILIYFDDELVTRESICSSVFY